MWWNLSIWLAKAVAGAGYSFSESHFYFPFYQRLTVLLCRKAVEFFYKRDFPVPSDKQFSVDRKKNQSVQI